MLDFNKPVKQKPKMITRKELIACTGKAAFDSFKAAARIGSKRRKSIQRTRGAYRCPHCRKFHLGAGL